MDIKSYNGNIEKYIMDSKNKFNNTIDIVKNNYKDFFIIKTGSVTSNQYKDIIFYSKWELDKSKKIALMPNCEDDIIAINVMPYMITEETINTAVSNITKKFNEQIKNGDYTYCDFDIGTDSANFHKLPDNNYQVVLVTSYKKNEKKSKKEGGSKGGPGWNVEKPNIKKNHLINNKTKQLTEEAINNNVKSNYYFPPITDPNAYDKELKNLGIKKDSPEFIAFLVDKALEAIGLLK